MTKLPISAYSLIRKLLSASTVFWLFQVYLTAQTLQPALRHYTTDEGLPSSECYEVIQDRDGYIWVSTDNGVSRFDGYEFKNYGTEEGLLDKTVLFMHEDHRGWIWMSTFSGNFYILRGDTITPYPYNHLLQEIRSKYYTVVDFIVGNDGSLHASLRDLGIIIIQANGTSQLISDKFSFGSGVYQHEGKVLQLQELAPNRSPEKHDLIIENLYKGILLFGFFTESLDSIITPLPHYSFTKASRTYSTSAAVHASVLDNFFIYQNNDYLYLFDSNYQVSPLIYEYGFINSTLLDRKGRIHFGHQNKKGVRLYNSIEDLFKLNIANSLLQQYTISHILEDLSGGIWYTTIEDGVYYAPNPDIMIMPPPKKAFSQLKILQTTPYQNESVVCLLDDESYWLLDTSYHYHPLPGQKFENFSETLFSTASKDLVICGHVFHYFAGSWKTLMHRRPLNNYAKPFTFSDLSSEISTSGTYWASEYEFRGVIHQITFLNNKFSFLKSIHLKDQERILALETLAKNTIALSGQKGVFLFNTDREQVVEMPILDSISTRVNDLQLYNNEFLLIATRGQGLYFFHTEKHDLNQLSIQDGLSSNSISKVFIDDQQNIWASGQSGLDKIYYTADSFHIQTYTMANGLPSNDIIDIDQFGDKIAVSTQFGIAFLPLTSKDSAATPKIPFHSTIYANNEIVTYKAGLRLPASNNDLRFVFSYLDYRYDGNAQYRYKINEQPDWTIIKNREITLPNLPSGDYHLLVQVQATGKDWEDGSEYFFEISPTFFERTSVRLAGLLAVFAMLYYFVSNQTRQLQQDQLKASLEEEILQLKQQAYRAQMNPHFIFNSLNAIQGLIMGGHAEKGKAVRFLSQFAQLIRNALDASSKESVSLKDEIQLLNNYLTLEQMRFNHAFSFDIKITPEVESDWIKIPPLLLQPYVENAVLHGMEKKNGNGMILLIFQMNGEDLLITIEDNGPGINVTKKAKIQVGKKLNRQSYGMSLSQKRLEVLQQHPKHLIVEEIIDAQNKITGTRIQLRIPVNISD